MKVKVINSKPSFIVELTLEEAQMVSHLTNCVEVKDYCDIFGKDFSAFLEKLGSEMSKAIINNSD